MAGSSNASTEALERLLETHPELRSRVEEATGDTAFPESTVEELAALVEDLPESAEIIAEFEELLDQELQQERGVAVAEARATLAQLSAIDVTPWRYGTHFYVRDGTVHLVNILGVMVTVILLSLGAPFWFSTLKSALALKDVLSPDIGGRQAERTRTDQGSNARNEPAP